MSIITYNGESKVIKRICELLDTMTGISFVVVQTLPTVDIQTNVIYLVPKTTTEVDNIYDEYINTDGTSQGWELIGTTEIDLTNYVQFSDLSTVATSGDYDDLIDKPTIPTVNDGTLTIQLNGENQQTFTANSSSDKTANIKAVDWVSNGKLGAKNLVPFPYNVPSGVTAATVTFTTDKNGIVDINGTATGGNAQFIICTNLNGILEEGKNYIVNGCVGGASNTYKIFIDKYSGSYTNVCNQYDGEDVEFEMPTGYSAVRLGIAVYSGKSVNHQKIKPMIRLKSDSDNTYQPYAKTNLELTTDKHEQYLADILGVKNLFPFPYYHPNYEEGYVVRNVTYTQENGVISVSGTCDNTGDSYCQVIRYVGQNPTPRYRTRIFRLKAGKYKLTGGVSSNVYLTLSYYTDTSSTNPTRTTVGNDFGDGVEFNVTEAQAETIYFTLFAMVKKGYQTQGETLKPMLRFANDTDESYMPFSLTNQELTEEVSEKRLVNENLNDIINSGFYLGSSGNSVTNKPTGVAQFGLMVVKTGESGVYVKQALTTYSGTEYVRYCNAGIWGNWTQL